MQLIIELPPELEMFLLKEAEKAGMTLSEYAIQIVIDRIDQAQQARETRA